MDTTLTDNLLLVDAVLSNDCDAIIDQMAKYDIIKLDLGCKFTKFTVLQYSKICIRYRLYSKVDECFSILDKLTWIVKYVIISRMHPFNIKHNTEQIFKKHNIKEFIANPDNCVIDKITVYELFLYQNVAQENFEEELLVLRKIVENEDELIKKCIESIIKKHINASKLIMNEKCEDFSSCGKEYSIICNILSDRKISALYNHEDTVGDKIISLIEDFPYVSEYKRKHLDIFQHIRVPAFNTDDLLTYSRKAYDYSRIRNKFLRLIIKYIQVNFVVTISFRLQASNVDAFISYYEENINIQEIKEMDAYVYDSEAFSYYLLANQYYVIVIELLRVLHDRGHPHTSDKLAILYRNQIVILENILTKYSHVFNVSTVLGHLIIAQFNINNKKVSANLYFKYGNYLYTTITAKPFLSKVLSVVGCSASRGNFRIVNSLILPMMKKYYDETLSVPGEHIPAFAEADAKIAGIDLYAVKCYTESDKDKFITDDEGTRICVICRDKIVNEVVVECSDCKKYIGHLYCVAKTCVSQAPRVNVQCMYCNVEKKIKLNHSLEEYVAFNELCSPYEDQIVIPAIGY